MFGYGALDMNNLAAEGVVRYFQLGPSALQPSPLDTDWTRERPAESSHSGYREIAPREEYSQMPITGQTATLTLNEPVCEADDNRTMRLPALADRRLTTSPPAYPCPPDYAPLPKMTETSLLLAPPPTYRRVANPSTADTAANYVEYDHSYVDVVVVALVLLNIVVWSVVIVVYAADFMSPGPPDQLFGPWRPADGYTAGPGLWMFEPDECRDGTIVTTFTRMCAAGRCFWGWVDCTEALGIKLVD